MRRSNPNSFLSLCLPVAMLVAGCSTTPVALERARENVARAQQEPQVSAHAPVALHEAAQSLRRAEQSWEKDGDTEEVEHLAYLAEKKAEIARAAAERRLAEAETQRFAQERDRVLLEARTREADQARQIAEARAREAEQALQMAELRAREAQQARSGEQAQAREAELARQLAEKQAREAELAREQAIKRAEELELAKDRAQTSASRIKELETQLAEFQARQTERGLELTLSDVLFEFDKADLKPGALRGLSPLIAFAKENPNRNILLEGHTDSIGSESYNLQLSQQRAETVKEFLVRSGVFPASITARGLGESYPMAPNDTDAGRLQNRRVQIVITNEIARNREKK